MNSVQDPIGSVLQALIQTFQREQINADAESLADMLWLAIHVPPEPAAVAVDLEDEDPDQSGNSQRTRVEPAESSPASGDRPGTLPLTLPQPRRPSTSPSLTGGGGQSNIATPAAPALRNTLLLGRSLRPLMHKVPSRTMTQLNEVETAIRMAEQPDSWVPVLEPKAERWLSVSLVVDQSRTAGTMARDHRRFSTTPEPSRRFSGCAGLAD